MKQSIFRVLAEVIHIIHFGILILGLLLYFLWDRFFFLYFSIFLFGLPSWLFTRRCFLTDFENYLRIKSGQDLSFIKGSFLGFWGKKLLGRHGPSNKTITWLVGIFYIVMTPMLLYELYLRIN